MIKEEQNAPDPSPDIVVILEEARKQVFDWAIEKEIDLLSIQLVMPSIRIHKVCSVWLFFDTDSRLKAYESDGTIQKLSERYLSVLQELKLPDEYFQGIRFFNDTDENVKRYASLKPIDEE